jgi:phosphate uptake regulator
VAMLTSVLRSNRAIEMNIEIMRAFAIYRAFLVENVDINKRIEELDDKINRVFEYLLDKIRGFDSNKPSDARNKIGYKQ